MPTCTSSVWGSFVALHADLARPQDIHEHTWSVEVTWPSDHFGDKRTRDFMLKEHLDQLRGTRLPDALSWAESLAAHFAEELCAISVRVWREEERCSAMFVRSDAEYRRARKAHGWR